MALAGVGAAATAALRPQREKRTTRVVPATAAIATPTGTLVIALCVEATGRGGRGGGEEQRDEDEAHRLPRPGEAFRGARGGGGIACIVIDEQACRSARSGWAIGDCIGAINSGSQNNYYTRFFKKQFLTKFILKILMFMIVLLERFLNLVF